MLCSTPIVVLIHELCEPREPTDVEESRHRAIWQLLADGQGRGEVFAAHFQLFQLWLLIKRRTKEWPRARHAKEIVREREGRGEG